MKIIIVFITFILKLSFSNAQSVEEIIASTNSAYLSLENYVDQGTYTIIDLKTNYVHSYSYFLSLDSLRNINHWIHDDQPIGSFGYTYTKSALKTEGIFTRLFEIPEALPADIATAALRLGGVGGGILDMIASMTFPYAYTEMKTSPSILLRSDVQNRLADTLINSQFCYVIELTKFVEITQEMIDRDNRVRDSILQLNMVKRPPNCDIPLPSNHDDRKPGKTAFVSKYFIQKSNYLIVRREKYGPIPPGSSKSILILNPRSNVENFQQYMVHE